MLSLHCWVAAINTELSITLDHDGSSRQLFKKHVERQPFVFSHRLSHSTLFKLPALRDLARFYVEHSLPYHLESGTVSVNNKWGPRPRHLTLCDAIDQIDDSKSLIIFNKAHQEPRYGVLLNDFLDELRVLLGSDTFSRYHQPLCTILVASPKHITPYHIDGGVNFLLQIQGMKTFYVFDGKDRRILTAHELELFWGGGDAGAAEYSEIKQRYATPFDLAPGLGVHVPIAFPHWAQNGESVSVAVSIALMLRENLEKDIFSLNYQLRRIGLYPREPGDSQALDYTKVAAVKAVRSIKRAFRSTRRVLRGKVPV